MQLDRRATFERAAADLPPVQTDSGIPVLPLYTADDVSDPARVAERLGYPGQPPYARGPYPTMYRGQLWTMRQYAGYGSVAQTNAHYRYLLDQGQTALSVAFDLPTQLGYDSDAPIARPEVGRVGVAVDTYHDMVDLFAELPLDKLSVNFTINATAPVILAFYLLAAEQQGAEPSKLRGTLQNDILKEFLARKAYVYPPSHSMRLVADVVEYASQRLPRFNPISITGYHAREAGCDAIQELGLTMASAIAYSTALLERGIAFDDFAPRLSFHFATTMDLFEEAAKFRAARRLWHRVATERFGARDARSSRLRSFSGCSGASLTAQQPLNNVVRSTVQCLGAVLGGAQSIHVMGYDEALTIPSSEAVTLALRTQQIVAHESGITRTIDPLAGSYYVERLTDELEARAAELVDRVDELGGAVRALEAGIPQRWIHEAAYEQARAIAEGTTVRVGVNRYVEPETFELGTFALDQESRAHQIERTRRHRAERSAQEWEASLARLRQAADSDDNLIPSILVAARAGATIGEISDVLRDAFGEHEEQSPW